MSFIGSINGKLRQFFSTHAQILDGRDCYLGCSGNFTLEQIITRQCENARLFSNDISLYTSALGHYLVDQPFKMEIVNEEFLFARDYIAKGGAYPAAVLSLMLAMFKFEKRNNPFNERMWLTYLTTFEQLLEKTVATTENAKRYIRLTDYTMIDVHDYFPRPGAVSIGFLPTYVGGYEKLFKRLDESIAWDAPSYGMLTTERREATLQKMAEGDYILYDDVRRDLPCVAQVELPGKKTVFIYSNLDFKKGVFRKKINETVRSFELLMPDEEIPPTAKVSIQECDLATINHYRNMYLSKKIQPGSGGPCYLVFADNKLFGFLIFQAYSMAAQPGEIYMMSDFVVPSKRHNRLAKLLLMVSLCQEVRQIIEEKNIKRYHAILTTAFTTRPVSMKYRGVYELAKRAEKHLNYRGTFGENTLQEVIATWSKRFKQHKRQ